VISLASDWPKGYFRKGKALAGLKVGMLTNVSVYWCCSVENFVIVCLQMC